MRASDGRADKRPGARPRVAVVNSNEDLVGLLKTILEDEGGYRVETSHVPSIKAGREDLVAFVERFDPEVIVWDLAPPYEENWTFLRLVRDLRCMEGRRFVLTTTNLRAVAPLVKVARVTAPIELLGKPYDLEQVLAAVRAALAAR